MSDRGGPKTPEGKEKSSRNSTSHGLRATRVLILAGESQDDYDEIREGWLATYEPENFHERSLVEQLILNHWMMQRANRRLLEAEAALVGSEETRYADGWTPAQEHTLDLVQRYKTTHERAFYRSLNAVESLRKDILRNELLKNKLIETKDKRIKDLEADLAKRPPAPEAMPEAKEKAVALPLTRAQQVFGRQKSKKKQKKAVISWLELIEKEKELGTGHLLPCDGNLPRARVVAHNGQPDALCARERGGCECPTCSHNRAILEARAA